MIQISWSFHIPSATGITMMKTVDPKEFWAEGGKTLGATERYRALIPRSVASGRKKLIFSTLRLVCSPVWEIFRRFAWPNLLNLQEICVIQISWSFHIPSATGITMMKIVDPTGFWAEGGKTLGATGRYRARIPRSVASGSKKFNFPPIIFAIKQKEAFSLQYTSNTSR